MNPPPERRLQKGDEAVLLHPGRQARGHSRGCNGSLSICVLCACVPLAFVCAARAPLGVSSVQPARLTCVRMHPCRLGVSSYRPLPQPVAVDAGSWSPEAYILRQVQSTVWRACTAFANAIDVGRPFCICASSTLQYPVHNLCLTSPLP